MAGGHNKLHSSPRESYHKYEVNAIQISYTLNGACRALGGVKNILMSPLLLDMCTELQSRWNDQWSWIEDQDPYPTVDQECLPA